MEAIATGFVSVGLATVGGEVRPLMNGHQELRHPQTIPAVQNTEPLPT